jgi:hypothetical protein
MNSSEPIIYVMVPMSVTKIWMVFKVLVCRSWCYHKGGYEEFYFLHNSVYTTESQPTFRRNMLPPSWLKNKPSKKPAWKQVEVFFRNIGWLPTAYMALYPRRWNISWPLCSRLKWTGYEAEHILPPTTRVFMMWCLIVQRKNFIFTNFTWDSCLYHFLWSKNMCFRRNV